MGIEAFGISMRFSESGACERLKEHLSDYPQISLGAMESVSGYDTIIGEFADGVHSIDLQLSREIATEQTTLALRFSLCSYDTIDAIFINLVSGIMRILECEVWLMT